MGNGVDALFPFSIFPLTLVFVARSPFNYVLENCMRQFLTFNYSSRNKIRCRCLFIFLGTAGDSFSYHSGMEFSTKDLSGSTGASARQWKGGWWFKSCHYAFLNGFYYKGSHSNSWGGVMWDKWKGPNYSAKRAEMKIKPVNI